MTQNLIDRRIKYTTSTPQPRFCEATLTVPEWKVIQRSRQLFNQGADMVIVIKTGEALKVRQVGKTEG